MGIKKGRKLRRWSVEEKKAICLQATTPGVSIAQVAQRYAMNANLIHKWLKDRRFAPKADVFDQETKFLPVEIEADVIRAPVSIGAPMPSTSTPLSAQRVDITLSDGRRILVEGATGLPAVLALVEGLMV